MIKYSSGCRLLFTFSGKW